MCWWWLPSTLSFFCILWFISFIFFFTFLFMFHLASVPTLSSVHCFSSFLSVIIFLLPAWMTQAYPRTPMFLFIPHLHPLITLASPYKKRGSLCSLACVALMCCPNLCECLCVLSTTKYVCQSAGYTLIIQDDNSCMGSEYVCVVDWRFQTGKPSPHELGITTADKQLIGLQLGLLGRKQIPPLGGFWNIKEHQMLS